MGVLVSESSRLRRYVDEILRPWADDFARRARMSCVECGVFPGDGARGWRAYLTVDDELATYCPDCGQREFGAHP